MKYGVRFCKNLYFERPNILNIVSQHLELGKQGEKMALDYLLAAGYLPLALNWRYGRAEVDIIAEKEEEWVFIEVKTRRGVKWGTPELAVHKAKQTRMLAAATAYTEERGYEGAVRFDIIAICWPEGGFPELEHYEDVFFVME
jgi:putative endonuclease